MSDSEIGNVTSLAEVVRFRQLLQETAGQIVDTWTRTCPFMGCTAQRVLPCEVEQGDGTSSRTQSWFAVFCECGASGRAGRTEREAYDHWNRRT